MGADYIEPDLVTTKDGVLVARHEPEIGGTTDVANHPEFASRKTTKSLDGVAVTGWFTEDFTLAELKTLRAKERIPDIRQHNTIYDGRYQVPTFQEVIDLASVCRGSCTGRSGSTRRPSTPRTSASRGSRWSPSSSTPLNRNGLNRPDAKVFVQSFEVTNLIELRRKLRVPLVQLTSATGAPFDFVDSGDPRTYADITSPAGLRDVAKYAKGLGPDKGQIIPRDAAGFLTTPTTLVAGRAPGRAEGPPVHVPRGERVPAGGLPLVDGAVPSTATCSRRSPSSEQPASTACSPTTRTSRWQRSGGGGLTL